MPLKIVFMGTPEFSVPTLKALIDNKFEILSIYTQPPRKSRRGQKINVSSVQKFSEENNLPIRNPENLNNEKEYNFIKSLSADISVVVAYGKLIPKNILKTTKLGFINVHASLLPKWRGAAPIQRAIMNSDKKIGISIMKIGEKLDSGPILISKEIDLDHNLIHGEIEKKLSVIGADLLLESLKIIRGGNSKFVNQIHSQATYAKKIDKGETKINWALDAARVLAHIHGLSPNPGAWFEYENERFKVLRAKKFLASGNPGALLDGNLTIACKSHSIQILEIQRQGKKKQTTEDFLLGKKISKGAILT
jgi:methionyl-tRNA formyltransferase|tara:strand:+ start:169 stop:1089 length:921 start_codon:yes stop_codon:yes gene_type:complete